MARATASLPCALLYPATSSAALPVGLQTRGDNDVPYWPVQSNWTYKEVWVHPVARWIWLMRDLAVPALVQGEADSAVEFIPKDPAPKSVVKADAAKGHFRILLAEGEYTVRCHGEERVRTFLPTGAYHLDLRPGRVLDFGISKVVSARGVVQIKLTARGAGLHRFNLRADNLTLASPAKELTLKRGMVGALGWHGQINSPERPWVVAVIADENPATRKELLGAAWE